LTNVDACQAEVCPNLCQEQKDCCTERKSLAQVLLERIQINMSKTSVKPEAAGPL
jgi:hypothetical protein